MRFALLALLLVAGGALRFTDLNWDRFQHVHPDERFIVWVADTMKFPSDLANALDPARSPLNPFRWPAEGQELAGQPRNYAYGHFPLYLLLFVSRVGVGLADWLANTTLVFPAWLQPLHTVGRHLADYAYLGLVGRALSALADLGTLLAVYWLGSRGAAQRIETDKRIEPVRPQAESVYPFQSVAPSSPHAWNSHLAGLLAAALYAFAVLPIQLSHYTTVDAVLTFCVTATVALAARWALRGERWTWLLAGVMCGLAVGSKFSAVLLVVPLAAAALYRLPETTLARQARVVAVRLAAVLAVAFVAFAITNPFALIEWRAFFRQIGEQNAMVSGVMDAPYTRQYIGTIPYLYFIAQLSQWGLGWPLGIAAWGGLVWAIVEFGRQRAGTVMTVMLAWVLPYFATTGLFHTKFLRYMAPIVPFLIAVGAAALVAGVRSLAARWGRKGATLGIALAAATLLVTIGWAAAFVQVYRQEHPWIAASRWIYEQAPEGAKLLTEHWDDALPLALDELMDRPTSREYVRVELPLWEPDTATKAGTLAAELASGDYLILASNRLSAPLPRLAGRYPMSSQYHRLLFRGELGYMRVAEFTAYPRLGSLIIADDHADESFTVYDHPHVQVFENTGRLSAEELAGRLGRYLPEARVATCVALSVSATHVTGTRVATHVTAARARPPGLARTVYQPPAPDAPLTLDQPVDTLPVVADFRWNRLASEHAVLAVLVWWFVASLLGWLAWPLLFPLLRGLSDRGYGLSRAFGWLLIGWVHWFGVSVGWWENRVEVLLILVLALAVASRVAWNARRTEMAAFWRSYGRLLRVEEGVYALAFLAFVGVRLLNPDLWQPWNGGEKFMEFAFLNGILRSPTFPPLDPYFAGGTLNYYYFGLYLVGVLIKLTGIVPEVAFNLAIPSLFALTALGVFSVAASLAPARRVQIGNRGFSRFIGVRVRDPQSPAGRPQIAPTGVRRPSSVFRLSSFVLGPLAAVASSLLLGNLQGLTWLTNAIVQRVRGGGPSAYDYWAASRIIPYTINEFPLWSFVFADLHPHLIAMPFGMLAAGFALNALRWPRNAHLRFSLRQAALNAGLLLIALGALGAINTWDLPTYALLVAGALVLTGWRGRGFLGAAAGLLAAGVITGLAVAAYWPFYAHYVPLIGGAAGPLIERFLGIVREGSPLSPWLHVWGAWLFVAFTYVVVETARGRMAHPSTAGTASLALGRSPAQDASAASDRGVEQPERSDRGEGDPSTGGMASPALGHSPAQDASAASDRGAEQPERSDSGVEGDPLTGGTASSALGRSPAQDASAASDRGVEGDPSTGGTASSALTDQRTLGRSPAQDAYARRGGRGWLIGLLALVAVLAVLVALGRPAAALAVLPLCLALPLALRRDRAPEDAFAALLLILGLGVIAGTELVYLRDFLEGGDWYRMNTLFKFSIPAWLLLGLAAARMLPAIWRAVMRAPLWLRVPWSGVTAVLLAGCLVFPFVGVARRVDDRFPGARPALGTLDATAYMTVGQYTWPNADSVIDLRYERAAIRWLLDNVSGTPVMAEAPAGSYEVNGENASYDYYRAGGLRVASLTGFPTFVGQHQYEQRPAEQVAERTSQGQRLFQTTDISEARRLLAELRVGYVYVGRLERILFSADALRKFDVLVAAGELQVVYQNPDVMIYRVLANR